MEYFGERDVFNGKEFVKCEIYINGKGKYFTLAGIDEPKEYVRFNPDEKRFEFGCPRSRKTNLHQ